MNAIDKLHEESSESEHQYPFYVLQKLINNLFGEIDFLEQDKKAVDAV